jgi:hypothetical protein
MPIDEILGDLPEEKSVESKYSNIVKNGFIGVINCRIYPISYGSGHDPNLFDKEFTVVKILPAERINSTVKEFLNYVFTQGRFTISPDFFESNLSEIMDSITFNNKNSMTYYNIQRDIDTIERLDLNSDISNCLYRARVEGELTLPVVEVRIELHEDE